MRRGQRRFSGRCRCQGTTGGAIGGQDFAHSGQRSMRRRIAHAGSIASYGTKHQPNNWVRRDKGDYHACETQAKELH